MKFKQAKRSPVKRAMSVGVVVFSLLSGGLVAQETGDDPESKDAAAPSEADKEMMKRMKALESEVQGLQQAARKKEGGLHNFLVTGFASTTLVDLDGSNSTFRTAFNPVILYRIGENFLFESELEFEFDFGAEGGETDVGVGYANGSYIVNDNLILGAGKFLTPFGIFGERIHPAWINKLPTAPLTAGHTGLVPASSIGAFARGGARAGSTKWNYSFYVSNGPRLNTGVDEPDEAGLLHFDNNVDTNNNKSVGGRVGCQPVPQLEFGVSYLTGGVTPSGSEVDSATANLYGVDLSYNPKMSPSSGRLEFRGEWVVSDIDTVTYDPTGAEGFGPLSYRNKRQGGYFQVAYRLPGEVKTLSPWECVVRYDTLDQPSDSPQPTDEDRVTLGLNHWLSPSSVVKVAYQFDNRSGAAQDRNGFILQLGLGF